MDSFYLLFKLQHIDTWFSYIWNFREEGADWVMVGPYFGVRLQNGDVPFYYANGVTYGVPWYDQNVEKVTNPFHVFYDYFYIISFTFSKTVSRL